MMTSVVACGNGALSGGHLPRAGLRGAAGAGQGAARARRVAPRRHPARPRLGDPQPRSATASASSTSAAAATTRRPTRATRSRRPPSARPRAGHPRLRGGRQPRPRPGHPVLPPASAPRCSRSAGSTTRTGSPFAGYDMYHSSYGPTRRRAAEARGDRPRDLGGGADPARHADRGAGRAASRARPARRTASCGGSSPRTRASTPTSTRPPALEAPLHPPARRASSSATTTSSPAHYKHVDGTSFAAPIVASRGGADARGQPAPDAAAGEADPDRDAPAACRTWRSTVRAGASSIPEAAVQAARSSSPEAGRSAFGDAAVARGRVRGTPSRRPRRWSPLL